MNAALPPFNSLVPAKRVESPACFHEFGVRTTNAMEPAPIQILHIEDNPLEAALMRELVSVSIPEQHELKWVHTMGEGIAELATNKYDVILVDLSLPDVSGIETVRTLTPKAGGVPVIVLSGYDDEKTSLEALRAGAQDYLVKGEVSSHLLRHAIRYAIERKRLDTALAWERELVDTLLENIPDRIYFKDKECRFLRINRALASLFGLEDPLDAVGHSVFDFFEKSIAEAMVKDDRKVMNTGEPVIGQVEEEALLDGKCNRVMTTKMPLRNPEGEIIGTFGLSRDISNLKTNSPNVVAP